MASGPQQAGGSFSMPERPVTGVPGAASRPWSPSQERGQTTIPMAASTPESNRVLFCGPVSGEFRTLKSFLTQASRSAGCSFDFVVAVGDFFGAIEWRRGMATDDFLTGRERFGIPVFVCDATHGHDRMEFANGSIMVLPNGRVSDVMGYRVATFAKGGPMHALHAISEIDFVMSTEGFADTGQLGSDDFSDWGIFKSVTNVSDEFVRFLAQTKPRYWVPTQNTSEFLCLPMPSQDPNVDPSTQASPCKVVLLDSLVDVCKSYASTEPSSMTGNSQQRFMHGFRVVKKNQLLVPAGGRCAGGTRQSAAQILLSSCALDDIDTTPRPITGHSRGASAVFRSSGELSPNSADPSADDSVSPPFKKPRLAAADDAGVRTTASTPVAEETAVDSSRGQPPRTDESGGPPPPALGGAQPQAAKFIPPWRTSEPRATPDEHCCLGSSSPAAFGKLAPVPKDDAGIWGSRGGSIIMAAVDDPSASGMMSTIISSSSAMRIADSPVIRLQMLGEAGGSSERGSENSPPEGRPPSSAAHHLRLLESLQKDPPSGRGMIAEPKRCYPTRLVSLTEMVAESPPQRFGETAETPAAAAAHNPSLMPSTTVFIPNAPFWLAKERIRDILSRYGDVIDIRCPRPLPRAQSARIWVDFATPDAAMTAVEDSAQSAGIFIDPKRKINVLMSIDQRGEAARPAVGGGRRDYDRLPPPRDMPGSVARRSGREALEGPNPRWTSDEFQTPRCAERRLAPQNAIDCPLSSCVPPMSPGRSCIPAIDKRPHDDCWFCLANPNTEKELVVSIGNEVYLSAAKGCLVEGHLLLLPLSHEPNMAGCPLPVLSEMDTFVSVIIDYFRKKGMEVIIFERHIPMRITRAMHTQVHIIPIPKGAVQTCFFSLSNVASMAEYIDVKVDPVPIGGALTSLSALHRDSTIKESELRRQAANVSLTPETPYVFLDLPAPPGQVGPSSSGTAQPSRIRRLLTCGRGRRLDLDFVRRTLATALGVQNRADWRNCVTDDPGAERQAAANLRNEFADSEKRLLSLLHSGSAYARM